MREKEKQRGHDIDTEIDEDKPGKQTLQSRTGHNRETIQKREKRTYLRSTTIHITLFTR